ncbi:hypothetical protein B0T18DRAFT_436213 [Schizothecium vesticola]|uniref:DUF1754-domain-containing protein n=1 Tax=Schizothecium vesticola TaxID=314040 RepID=A0AA40F685_9PEZI|nr:hypothetical protein B0T18DRAFT_436213 [Schizothecium vesticola]
MPADEYSSVARGPLKLKGAKVTKHKKKSKKDKEKATSDVERALATTKSTADVRSEDEERVPTKQRSEERGASEDVDVAERSGSAALEDDSKTETERRFAEAKRKRLKELTESGRVRPELLKTHKQRVEDLNSHLSRLSEHHDMPKIGPG